MTIEHNVASDGTTTSPYDGERHEPRNVSRATVGDVYIADGAGSGAWGNPNTEHEYATIYTADGSTPSGSITTAVELSLFATDGPDGVAVADSTNNRITLTTAGDYMVTFFISYTGSASNAVWQFHARLDAVETYLGVHRKIGTGADTGACSFGGILPATAGQQLTIYAESDTSSTITPTDMQLTAVLMKPA